MECIRTILDVIIAICTIIAILLSPVIAIVIGEWLLNRRRKQEIKDSVLRDLISYRHDLKHVEFLKAINSVPIIFKDHPEIIKLHKDFYNALTTKQPDRFAILVSLIINICKQMGYGKDIEPSDIDNVFTPPSE